jgi:hypothetical protein
MRGLVCGVGDMVRMEGRSKSSFFFVRARFYFHAFVLVKSAGSQFDTLARKSKLTNQFEPALPLSSATAVFH